MKKDKSRKSLQKKNPTITDVAKLADVTIGTVSHVINGTAPISEKTTKRVKKAIKTLNYVPNTFARSLRRNKSKMVGILVLDMMAEFYCSIARSFMDHAYEDGYSVMLCSFQDSLDREKQELDILVEHQMDAIVLCGGRNDEKLIDSVSNSGIPIILCDRHIADSNYSSIEFDNETAMRQVAEHLKELGYTKVGYVSEPLELCNLKDRLSGFKEGIALQGLEILGENIFSIDYSTLDKIKNSYDFMTDLLGKRSRKQLPDVFVTTSDLLAIGLIVALDKAGYKVPEDFGIVGFDDISISAHISTPLTTVSQDSKLMAKAVWEIVKDTIEGNVEKPINMKINTELVIRESC
jgi:DNA-binding LacI/PurR family transcriptional regulator